MDSRQRLPDDWAITVGLVDEKVAEQVLTRRTDIDHVEDVGHTASGRGAEEQLVVVAADPDRHDRCRGLEGVELGRLVRVLGCGHVGCRGAAAATVGQGEAEGGGAQVRVVPRRPEAEEEERPGPAAVPRGRRCRSRRGRRTTPGPRPQAAATAAPGPPRTRLPVPPTPPALAIARPCFSSRPPSDDP